MDYGNAMNVNSDVESKVKYITEESSKIDNAETTGYIGEYLGKLVRSTVTGSIDYITDKGAIKHFYSPETLAVTAGRNNCPLDVIEVNEDFNSETFREKYPYLYDGTPMASAGTGLEMSGQGCGNAGKNIFVSKKSPVITQYRGCQNANESDLDMKDIGNGDIYTFDQCKDLAASKDYKSFSLNTSETLYSVDKWVNENKEETTKLLGELTRTNGANEFQLFDNVLKEYKPYGKCYASSKPIKPGRDIIYASQTPFRLKTVNMPLDTATYMFKDYNLFSKQNLNLGVKAVFTTGISGIFNLTANGIILVQWASSLSDDKCSYGGGVNLKTLKATFGANCAAKSTEYPDDPTCSIQPGNYTTNALLNINGNNANIEDPPTSAWNKNAARDHIETTNFWNLSNPTFAVGTKWEKYEYFSPDNTIGPAEDPCVNCHKDYSISYQCGANTDINTFSLPPGSGGKQVNLDCSTSYWNCFCGIGISDSGNVKFLRGFYGSSGVSDDPVIDVPATTEPLVPVPGLLDSDDFTALRGGTVRNVQFNNEMYNILQSTNSLSGTQKLVSPTGTCYLEVSSLGYLTINYNIASLTCNNKSGNNTGVNNGSSEVQMWGQPNMAPNQYAVNEIITKPYLQNFGKMGYVDDDMNLHEYPVNMLPSYSTKENASAIGNPYGSNTGTLEECKVKCSGDTACNFFQYSNGSCSYYDKIENTLDSAGSSVFTKNAPAESPNGTCPFENAVDITSSDWQFYAKGENMNPNYSCYTKNPDYLNKQKDSVQKVTFDATSELVKQSQYNDMLMNKFSKQSKDFMNVIDNEKKISSEIDMYGRPTISEGFDTFTLNSMNIDMENLRTRNHTRVIFWSFIALTLVIMTLRLIQLYSK